MDPLQNYIQNWVCVCVCVCVSVGIFLSEDMLDFCPGKVLYKPGPERYRAQLDSPGLQDCQVLCELKKKKKKKDQPPPLSLKGTYRPLQTYSLSSTPLRCQAVNLPSFICKSDDGASSGGQCSEWLHSCGWVSQSLALPLYLSSTPLGFGYDRWESGPWTQEY